jgi:hypothetical protein
VKQGGFRRPILAWRLLVSMAFDRDRSPLLHARTFHQQLRVPDALADTATALLDLTSHGVPAAQNVRG